MVRFERTTPWSQTRCTARLCYTPKSHLKNLVPEVGLEPTRPFGHCDLNAARLPIPPPGQVDFNQPWASSTAAFVVHTPCLSRTSGSCLALAGSEVSEPDGCPSPARSACIEAVLHRQSSSRRKCQTWRTSKTGAQEGTRTPTAFRPLRPQRSASTNSATWAGGTTRCCTLYHEFSIMQLCIGRPERIQTSDLSVRSAALCSTELRACIGGGGRIRTCESLGQNQVPWTARRHSPTETMVGTEGLEPPAFALSRRCSTPELSTHNR